ncbi:hypothetical protein [uncultured Amphritea sp.]|uniref:hypothetical protein n=1 Tax=uncultured Amphritea sp. TaxID=981605 RepID=UPI0026189B5F|nr:hypothetical protein [uncultured Amphritea sp.]
MQLNNLLATYFFTRSGNPTLLQWLYGRPRFLYFKLIGCIARINTFSFTKYGVIIAVVDNVSSDATADENCGLICKARILMHKNTLWVDGREVDLVLGMSVSAGVKT